LALFVAESGATCAAIFTTNRFRAAPVVLSESALRRNGGNVRAVLVNSGCANAITGRSGTQAAREVRRRAAQLLGCPETEILLASTGVIGTPLPKATIRSALPDAVARLSAHGVEAASHAILTTDVGPKVARAAFTWNGRRANLVGVAKGAGMIHPRMATMLGFLMTDAPASAAFLKQVLRESASKTFNAISVDGDTSTNDSVFLMASNRIEGPRMDSGSDTAGFRSAMDSVCRQLAWMIVRDGEGASRVLDVEVRGAKSERDARVAAHAIGTSPLVKTAIHGGDPNWGRFLAALGRSGVRFSARRLAMRFGDVTIVKNGSVASYRERDAVRVFAKERVPVVIDLGTGRAGASLLVSDLGHDYVSLNADYRT
jgi:glutamate N-acetyltransferase/amino-acid N-acetyltransferase